MMRTQQNGDSEKIYIKKKKKSKQVVIRKKWNTQMYQKEEK